MIETKNAAFDIEAERKKILDGTYPARIIQGRQNKHIKGAREFMQKSQSEEITNPGSKPSILTADAQILVEKYKGTGDIRPYKGSEFPRETIDTDIVIGKTWIISKQKYVETKRFIIIYSSTGVHIVPVNDYKRER
jgi:hypothetical protein